MLSCMALTAFAEITPAVEPDSALTVAGLVLTSPGSAYPRLSRQQLPPVCDPERLHCRLTSFDSPSESSLPKCRRDWEWTGKSGTCRVTGQWRWP